jgi:hypothetical protein
MSGTSRLRLAPLLLLLTPAFAQAPGWVLYTHPEKLMSARFPGKPTESEQEAPTAIGNIRFKMAVFAEATRAFMATAIAYPLPKDTKFDIKKALDGARDQMVANIKGKVTSEKPMKLDGFAGREVIFEAPGQNNTSIHGIARIFASAKPPSAFVAGAMRMTDTPDPDAQKFLDSIHLGKRVETGP